MGDERDLRSKAMAVHEAMVEAYGEPERDPRLDPVATLVTTILSQNTSDINQHRAFRSLRERFPTWQEVLRAPVQEVEEAIQSAGLAAQRAPRIQAALRHILCERGELALGFLREMPVDEARRWLTSIKGVGPKTAAIVLLFSLGMPAFPVDTHVHRVSGRLGLTPTRASAARAQEILEGIIPRELYYPFHINLITHGRRVCKAPTPLCDRCFITALCDYYQQHVV